MNTKIKQFASAGLIEALRMIRCGFELETQSYCGQTSSEYDEDTLTDMAWEDAKELAREDVDVASILNTYKKEYPEEYKAWIKSIKDSGIKENPYVVRDYILREYLNTGSTSGHYWGAFSTLDRLNRQAARELADSYFDVCYQNVIENYSPCWPEIKDVEFGADQSVNGPEIRTRGGLSVQSFMKALKSVVSEELDVDEGCSFHIHLSIPGVRHSYGRNLQAAIMDYFLSNISRLPECVRTRLESEAVRFFEFHLSQEKFRFVHWHPQGTIEFRLFGNVDNYKDGMKCLLEAVRALQHAYKVVHLKQGKLNLSEQMLVGINVLVEAESTGADFITEIKSRWKERRALQVEQGRQSA